MKIIILGLVFILFFSCKDGLSTNEPQSPDTSTLKEYLVFGNVAVGWGCRTSRLFMIANGQLYADTSNAYCEAFRAQKPYIFKGYLLPETEYQKAKAMLTELPTGFFTSAQKVFGCPGCADGGMLYLSYKKEGIIDANWQVDDAVYYRETDTNNKPFPPYVANYGKLAFQVFGKVKVK